MTSLGEHKSTTKFAEVIYDAQTLPAFRFVSLQPGFAARRPAPAHPDVSHLALPGNSLASVDSRLLRAQGEIEVVVRLGDAPLAVAQGEGAKKHGGKLTKAQQRAHVAGLSQKQDDLMRAVVAWAGASFRGSASR